MCLFFTYLQRTLTPQEAFLKRKQEKEAKRASAPAPEKKPAAPVNRGPVKGGSVS